MSIIFDDEQCVENRLMCTIFADGELGLFDISEK